VNQKSGALTAAPPRHCPYVCCYWLCCHSDADLYSPEAVSAATERHVPPITVEQLIQQFSGEVGWDNTVVGGGVLSSTQASKVLCRLTHEVDWYVSQSVYILRHDGVYFSEFVEN